MSARAPDEEARETAVRNARKGDPEDVATWSLSMEDGRHVEIDRMRPTRFLIGQSQGCDLVLADELVSRRHAALEVLQDGLRITDLESTNGTWVNGVRIVEAYLRDGSSIQVGDTIVRVHSGPVRRAPPATTMRFGAVIGTSVEMRRLYPLVERLAASDVPIVIEGETGTGKEVLAESIHDASKRAQGPFIVFDCTAVPSELFESALFGHEKGAFTGAVNARKGAFELAHGGTLFLDEIGELAGVLQPKLLRAIERSEIQRVGAEKWQKVDVRILVATRRDLDKEVAAGRFRDDLLYRLAVGRLELPPLRHRHGDIPLLTRHFWRELGGRERPLPDEASLATFESYHWPGNVRELRNAVMRRLALGDLAPPPGQAESPSSTNLIERVLAMDLPLPRARQKVVEEFERAYVERVLAKYQGNVRRAAAASGIARRYFQLLRARQQNG